MAVAVGVGDLLKAVMKVKDALDKAEANKQSCGQLAEQWMRMRTCLTRLQEEPTSFGESHLPALEATMKLADETEQFVAKFNRMGCFKRVVRLLVGVSGDEAKIKDLGKRLDGLMQEMQLALQADTKASVSEIGASISQIRMHANANAPRLPLAALSVAPPRHGYQPREQLDGALLTWFSGTGAVFVVWGLGGAGKSTLAQRFAAKLPETDGDGRGPVLFLRAEGILESYAQLVDNYGGGGSQKLSPGEVRQQVHRLLQSDLWRGRWVCVLDNLPAPSKEAMENAGLGWLLDEFPWRAGRTIITTRSREWVEQVRHVGSPPHAEVDAAGGSYSVEVGSFSEAEAMEWVKEKVPRWAGDEAGVRDLVQYLHCFTLAVVQAAEFARFHSLSSKTETPAKYLGALRLAKRLTFSKDKQGESLPGILYFKYLR